MPHAYTKRIRFHLLHDSLSPLTHTKPHALPALYAAIRLLVCVLWRSLVAFFAMSQPISSRLWPRASVVSFPAFNAQPVALAVDPGVGGGKLVPPLAVSLGGLCVTPRANAVKIVLPLGSSVQVVGVKAPRVVTLVSADMTIRYWAYPRFVSHPVDDKVLASDLNASVVVRDHVSGPYPAPRYLVQVALTQQQGFDFFCIHFASIVKNTPYCISTGKWNIVGVRDYPVLHYPRSSQKKNPNFRGTDRTGQRDPPADHSPIINVEPLIPLFPARLTVERMPFPNRLSH